MMMAPSLRQQTGVALVVSLIFLLVMTLLALSSIQTSVLEEKMAGNFRNSQLAFEAAEAGLSAAERTLLANTLRDPIFPWIRNAQAPLWQTINWAVGTPGIHAPFNANPLGGVAAQPLYIIEELAPIRDSPSLEVGQPIKSRFYRITSLGIGGTETTNSMLQTTYKRPL